MHFHNHALVSTEKKRFHALRGKIFRFCGLWLSFFGLYTISTTCPFCGQPGCPVGAGGAGLMSGLMALFLHSGKTIWFKFKALFQPKDHIEGESDHDTKNRKSVVFIEKN